MRTIPEFQRSGSETVYSKAYLASGEAPDFADESFRGFLGQISGFLYC